MVWQRWTLVTKHGSHKMETSLPSLGFLNDMWKVTVNITCTDGYFARGFRCELCPLGTFGVNSECVPCSAGYFSDRLLATECQPCPKYQYQSLPGQIACIDCPADADCTQVNFTCHAGYSLNLKNNGCLKCPDGFWKERAGNQECISCPLDAEYCRVSTCIRAGNQPCTTRTKSSGDILFFLTVFVFVTSFAINLMLGFFIGYLKYFKSIMPLPEMNHLNVLITTDSTTATSITANSCSVTVSSSDIHLKHSREIEMYISA